MKYSVKQIELNFGGEANGWENEYGILLTNKLRDGLIKTVKI